MIDAHLKQQTYIEISRDMKKRRYVEEDLYDSENNVDVAAEIERLKRPRAGDI